MFQLSQRALVRQRLFRFIDPLMLSAALFIAGVLRWQSFPPEQFSWLVVLVTPLSGVVFAVIGAYDGLRSQRFSDWCRRPLLGVIIILVIFLLAVYFAKENSNLSRIVVLSWLAISTAALLVTRIIFYRIITKWHRSGVGIERVLLVGERELCLSWVERLLGKQELGLRIAGMVTNEGSPTLSAAQVNEHEPTRVRPLTEPDMITLENIEKEIEERKIDRVIICGHMSDQQLVSSVLKALIPTAVTVQYAPDYLMTPLFMFRVSECAGRPIIDLSASPLSESDRAIKWCEDKILGLFILFLISPLLLLAAIAVKLSSPGPLFFIQDRHGLHGRLIRVFKFRTMYHGDLPPERAKLAVKEALETKVDDGETSHYYKGQKFSQAVHDDPRITPVGKFLRGTSLDELPQFFNVLLGEMSIVGPRPHAVAHNLNYVSDVTELMRRHYVKPGITGLAQISGSRGETKTADDMRRRVEYDLEYIRNWSLWLDLKIIALTSIRGWINRQP
jgi:putative colanic acid biosysnthesis UDP-glucose lipid carrier transferase